MSRAASIRALAVVVAAVAAASAAAPAHAQIADAIGRPLPRPDLAPGTVTVRVVIGEMSRPLASADVRLVVAGDARIARTDAAGRVSFDGVPAGATVQVFTDGEQGEVASVEFPMPSDRGVAMLLSTVPFKADATGAGARPPPRVMAGQPRPEQADPAGRVTVRVSRNDWDDTSDLANLPVVMVAFAADDRVALKVVPTDAGGRAVFDNLDTSGLTAYYALAVVPRDGGEDRLMSLPITPGPEHGVRVILSGERRGTGAPPIDDLDRFVPQPELPAGRVMVVFAGETPARGTPVELVAAATGEVVATAKVDRGRPLPSTIDASIGEPAPSDAAAAGEARVTVKVQGMGLPRVPVLVRPVSPATGADAAGAAGAPAPAEATGTTDDHGLVTLAGLPAGVPLELVVTVEGKSFTGAPFTLARGAAAGVEIAVEAGFELLTLVDATFDGVPRSGEAAYLAQLVVGGERHRSPPFVLGATRGVVVPVFVMPRIQLTFQLDAMVDDDYLATRGTWVIQNASWAPWAGPSEGMRIPAPAGATGLVVADMDKTWVAAESSAFRLLRPVPPLGSQFRAGFSIPVDDGQVAWDLPLPLGAARSSMAIQRTPGMEVILPPGITGTDVPQGGVVFLAIRNIEIPANQRMVFSIRGLPRRPSWQRWSKVGVGVAAGLLIGVGLWFALGRAMAGAAGPAGAAAGTTRKQRKRRIDELLDAIAAIDRDSAKPDVDADRRAALVAELEALYREEQVAAAARAGGKTGDGAAGN